MSSLSSRSSAHRSGRTLGGASPPGNSSRVMRRDIVPHQGVFEGFDGSENGKHGLPSERFPSSDDDSQSPAPSGLSPSASINLVGNSTLNKMTHEAAVNCEKDQVMQRKMYGEDRGFPYSVDREKDRVTQGKIYGEDHGFSYSVDLTNSVKHLILSVHLLISQETFVML
jgi:hypothetical protein